MLEPAVAGRMLCGVIREGEDIECEDEEEGFREHQGVL